MKKIAHFISFFISFSFSLFWNGKISLSWMYWFWGVVVGNLLSYGTHFLTLKLQLEPFSLHYYVLPYYVFWMVGTWRSAHNYKGPNFWANLVQLLIILSVIGLGVIGLVSLLFI